MLHENELESGLEIFVFVGCWQERCRGGRLGGWIRGSKHRRRGVSSGRLRGCLRGRIELCGGICGLLERWRNLVR